MIFVFDYSSYLSGAIAVQATPVAERYEAEYGLLGAPDGEDVFAAARSANYITYSVTFTGALVYNIKDLAFNYSNVESIRIRIINDATDEEEYVEVS